MNRRWLLVLVGLALSLIFGPGPGGAQQVSLRGATSEETFRKHAEASFKMLDQNQDGYLFGDEIPEDIRVLLAANNARADTRLSFQNYLPYRELTYQLQVAAFFKNRDRNQDGFLQKEEMPVLLLNKLATYSRGGDRVTFEEFLQFSRDRDFPPAAPPQMGEPPMAKRTVTAPEVIVIDERELEKRPPVYRAGNLPKGMPAWFEKLDADEDGQIALFEWRKAGKPIGEFTAWDRNDDGLITIEEVLYKLEQDRLATQREGKAITVGSGKEFRESMENGAPTAYLVKLEKGKTYRIDMVAENTQMLDPYLYLLDHQGKLLAKDDDSGGQLNARIQFTPKATGNFRIIAASVGNRGNGEFFLIIQDKTPSAREMPQ